MGFRYGLILIALFESFIVVSYSQDVKQKFTPKVSFGKFRSDTVNYVKANDIVLADSLFISSKEITGDRITSFDLFTKLDSVTVIENAYGNRLSKKQILLIRLAAVDQLIYLQGITVKSPGKDKVKIPTRYAFRIRK